MSKKLLRIKSSLIYFNIFTYFVGFLTVSNCLAQSENVNVNFNNRVQSHSMSGFLHGITSFEQNNPSIDLVSPLKPKYWRAWVPEKDKARLLDRYKQLGAKIVFVLSDGWMQEDNWKLPSDDWTKFEDYVRDQANKYKNEDYIWDIWNEPNVLGKIGNIYEEIYARSYKILHEVIGDKLQITGPSVANWDPDRITKLLDYCLVQGCKMTALSWHPLEYSEDEMLDTPRQVKYAQDNFVNNPKYSSIGIKQILLTEIIGIAYRTNPAGTLAGLYYSETSGADGAMHSCWPDDDLVNPDGSHRSACDGGILDHLIDPGNWKPRPVWWSYKLYADGVEKRVETNAPTDNVISLASLIDSNHFTGQILVGYYFSTKNPNPQTKTVTVNIAGLENLKGKNAKIRIEAASGRSGETNPLESLIFVEEKNILINNNGQASFDISINLNDVLSLTITSDGSVSLPVPTPTLTSTNVSTKPTLIPTIVPTSTPNVVFTAPSISNTPLPTPTNSLADNISSLINSEPSLKSNCKIRISSDQSGNSSSGSIISKLENSCNLNAPFVGNGDPELKTNIFNGRPGIRFDGNNDYFKYDGNLFTGSDFSIFVVFKQNGDNAGRKIFDSINGTSRRLVSIENSGLASLGNILTDINLDKPTILSTIKKGDLVFSSVNSTNLVEGTSKGFNYNSSEQSTLIGSRFSYSDKFDGDIAELVAFDSALTDSQASALILELSKKWLEQIL